MKRSRTVLLAGILVIAGESAFAQGDLRSRLQPVTAPVRRAGVYHVATGTWTRDASLTSLTGPDVIYNNSCFTGYFASQDQITGEKWQHRSRVPSLSGPTTPSVFYGSPRNDEAPGCATSYTVNGFQFAYCSGATSPLTYVHEFAHSYADCADADMVPNYSFTLSGLPGGSPTGSQMCWLVDVDLSSTTPPFVLQADGDGIYLGPSTLEQFGWSFGPTSLVGPADATGPILAGNYTWTGGPITGSLTPCTGTDGTIWDSPVNLSEEGTGMASNDYFRVTAASPTAPLGPGCYSFGPIVHSDFYLKLFADTGVSPIMIPVCLPGQGGVIACPCGNPPAGGGLGCDNFGVGPAKSGTLHACGSPSLASDSVVLHATGENVGSLTVFWTGKDPLHPTGLPHAAGVRCVTSALKRLYTGVSGTAAGVVSRPRPNVDPSVSARTAALGSPISAGDVRHYFTTYRDPGAAGPCGNSSSTFNLTNAGSIAWSP